MRKNVYLDTETTDFVPGQICELSLISEDYKTHEILGAKNYFFKVDNVSEGAEAVHGLSVSLLEQYSNGLTFKDLHQEILAELEDATIVAHNEAFDEKFLSIEFWRCGVSFEPIDRSCTMKAFKDILKLPSPRYRNGYKWPKVEEVLNYLNIDTDKVIDYTQKLFNGESNKFHDSRFDTTAIFVAVNVYREKLNGGTAWHNQFCK